MTVVTFVRHGESLVNAGHAFYGPPSQIPLTDLGRDQARRAAHGWDRAPDRVIVSPFARTRATAAPTLERFPDAPVFEWPIEEFHYLCAEQCACLNAEEYIALSKTYWSRADPDRIDGTHAESFRAFIQRVDAGLDRLDELPGGWSVLFSHALFMRAVHWRLTAGRGPVTSETMRAYRQDGLSEIKNCATLTFRRDADAWRAE